MLEIRHLTSSYESMPVLRGIDLAIGQGEIFCLLGPSGCGKTTLLRIIAGLENGDTGEIWVNGENIASAPVHTRDFGLMFQDFALFPHMNVAQNIVFGLRMRRMPKHEQEKRLHEVLALVGLEGFEKRDVNQLSGGEKQRVALARSLAPSPHLLMLDEPLGSLDAGLRERLAVELRDIIKRIGLTAIYVTHDHHEAFAIADRIAIMNDGYIEQIDTPEVLYKRPETIFAAQFLGLTNIVRADDCKDGIAYTSIGNFPATDCTRALLIHPDGIRLDEQGHLAGQVSECVFQGDAYRLRAQITPEITFIMRVVSRNGRIPQAGERVTLAFDETAVVPLEEKRADRR